MNKSFVRAAGVVIALALGAGPVMAKATYCMDPTTHKRISCKTAPPRTQVAQAATPAAAAPPTVAAASAPPAPAGEHKGKKCGRSYIAANKTCHKAGG